MLNIETGNRDGQCNLLKIFQCAFSFSEFFFLPWSYQSEASSCGCIISQICLGIFSLSIRLSEVGKWLWEVAYESGSWGKGSLTVKKNLIIALGLTALSLVIETKWVTQHPSCPPSHCKLWCRDRFPIYEIQKAETAIIFWSPTAIVIIFFCIKNIGQ